MIKEKSANKTVELAFSSFNELPKEQLYPLFEEFLKFLKEKNIPFPQNQPGIPLSIFSTRLSILEAIVKYLRENKELSYPEIASILKRNPGPVGVIYRTAKSKFLPSLDVSSQVTIPLTIFSKNLTVFESVIAYLKAIGFSFRKISLLLKRDYKTVWTTYSRAKKKRGVMHE